MTGAARVVRGDVVRFCRLHKALGLPLFSAVLCDAPYGLSFMGKSWDHIEGIAFDPETWRAIADCLMDGAYLFVFAGNLNDDLISVAMRRAGLVKQHKALAWSQGSGLPKTTQISTQVDKAAGEKGTYGDYKGSDHAIKRIPGNQRMHEGYQRPWRDDPEAEDRNAREYLSATPLAQTWAGHRYGAQALRNLVESILIFRKPYEGKPYECIVRTGAGALNIEGSRIGTEPAFVGRKGGKSSGGIMNLVEGHRVTSGGQGRHPANFLLQHDRRCIPRGTKRVRNHSGSVSGNEPSLPTEGVTYGKYNERLQFDSYGNADGLETVTDFSCVPECPVRLLDEQAGERGGGARPAKRGAGTKGYHGWPNGTDDGIRIEYDTGGPSRFSYCADWSHEALERIEAASAVRYQAKPSRAERDAGLDGLPSKFLRTLGDGIGAREHNENEPSAYVKNFHPTVKPISLMKYLAGLLLPPDAYAPRRLFCPFAGSGSEMIGAALAGWEEIVGVELEPDYVTIARARIAWWQNASRYGQTDPAKILANAPEGPNERGDRQLDMFAPDNGKIDAP